MNRFETYFDAFYAYFTTEPDQFFKKLGQFENFGFVIMSTRENVRLIARAPFQQCGMCDQQRLRPACGYAQSDQSLCLSLEYSMSVMSIL